MYCFHLFGWFSQQSQTETFISTSCPDFHLHGDHLQFLLLLLLWDFNKSKQTHWSTATVRKILDITSLYRPQHQTPVKPAARSSSHKQPHPRTSSQKHKDLTAPPTQSRGRQPEKPQNAEREENGETEENKSKRCPLLCDGTAASNKPCKDTNAHTLTQLLAAGTKYTLRRELRGGGRHRRDRGVEVTGSRGYDTCTDT